MIEITGDVWEFYKQPKSVICIPTNGDINCYGDAIMGRGVAAQAKLRCNFIDTELGGCIIANGNIINWLDHGLVLSFPVKHHWNEKANFDLIQKSRDELKKIATFLDEHKFYLPRPGCGNGGLDYNDVRPLMLSLPDNVYVISFEEVLCSSST
jgi:hypothetical protein